jgi:hypothetical protein
MGKFSQVGSIPAKSIVEKVEKTKLIRGKKDRRTEPRPQNRNLRKTLL